MKASAERKTALLEGRHTARSLLAVNAPMVVISRPSSDELGDWQGADPVTGFQLVKTADGGLLRIADLVDELANHRATI